MIANSHPFEQLAQKTMFPEPSTEYNPVSGFAEDWSWTSEVAKARWRGKEEKSFSGSALPDHQLVCTGCPTPTTYEPKFHWEISPIESDCVLCVQSQGKSTSACCFLFQRMRCGTFPSFWKMWKNPGHQILLEGPIFPMSCLSKTS